MDGTTEYRYDASGNRVMKISGGVTTYYVLGAGEYASGAWQRLYVSVNGSKLLEYASGTTYFFHADHLRTPRAQTSLAGAVVGSWSNYPYGEQWLQSGVTNKDRYTGKERDAESSNDYFGARYYFGDDARWLQVDSGAGTVEDPQSLNRYHYCFGDPVNWIDPDGRDPEFADEPRGPRPTRASTEGKHTVSTGNSRAAAAASQTISNSLHVKTVRDATNQASVRR